jgi:hypothetical protein
VLVVSLGDRVHARDLSFGMVPAAILLAEALVLKGVDVGVMYLFPRYKLVEGVGGVRWSSK